MAVADLAALGWDPAYAAAFGALPGADLVPGRVILEHNHVFRVVAAERVWLAEVAGRLRHRAAGRDELPAVGDWVALEPPRTGDRAVIRAILPRRTRFSRKVAGRVTTEQVVAANIDTVLIVFALETDVSVAGIERYLVTSRRSGAAAVVALNKADRHPAPAEAAAAVAARLPGVPVHAVSAMADGGLASLAPYLGPGRTVAFLGPSGAGKSSIINRLIGRELLPTADVRPADARGRHTSVHRQLVVLPSGGVVIDTPGMRELQLWSEDEGLVDAFEDLQALGAGCRFRDCRHDREPGCAVRAAVESGDVDAGRYANFLKLQAEREAFERRHGERARRESARRGRIAQKALKALARNRRR